MVVWRRGGDEKDFERWVCEGRFASERACLMFEARATLVSQMRKARKSGALRLLSLTISRRSSFHFRQLRLHHVMRPPLPAFCGLRTAFFEDTTSESASWQRLDMERLAKPRRSKSRIA